MDAHVKVIAWLYIVFGVLGILFAVVLGLLIAGGGWISGDDVAIMVTSIVALVMGALLVLVSVPGIIVGGGLLNYKEWARISAIVLGILNLPGFPIGTALGLYTLFILLDSQTLALFDQKTVLE
jgi:hypothetical protein